MQKELNCPCCEKVNELVDFMLKRAAHFSILDWTIFKTCLISFGVLIGAIFAKLFKKLAPLMAIVFMASWVYLAWRIFFAGDDE